MFRARRYYGYMAVTSAVLSVEEFGRLPQPAGGVRQELHHGELVELPPVRILHTKIQRRLVSLIEAQLNPAEYEWTRSFRFAPLLNMRCGWRMWRCSALRS